MDPLTLFALANGAVAAVKKGCQLYKDMKSAAGDIKDVLKDLDDQFSKAHPPSKPATVAQKNAYVEEKNRVIELNKQAKENKHTDVFQEIGDHLGAYYDNYYKCIAVFEEEERRSKREIYTGDASLGKRALQRVLMKKQLEQMGTELRELMVYQSPPELGALYTEVEEMMKVMGREQKTVIAREIEKHKIESERKRKFREKLTRDFLVGIIIILFVFCVMFMFMYAINLRQDRYPDLGNCPMPKGSWLYKKWTRTVWAECR